MRESLSDHFRSWRIEDTNHNTNSNGRNDGANEQRKLLIFWCCSYNVSCLQVLRSSTSVRRSNTYHPPYYQGQWFVKLARPSDACENQTRTHQCCYRHSGYRIVTGSHQSNDTARHSNEEKTENNN